MSYIGARFIKNQKDHSEYKLRSYAIGDTFVIDISKCNFRNGLQNIIMELSVSEARNLKDQLDQFIRMNQRSNR